MVKKTNKQTFFFLAVLLVLSISIGLSNYIRMPISSFSDGFAFLIHACILIATLWGVLYLISINRFVFSVFFVPVVFVSITSAYLLYVPNIMVSSAIVDVTLNAGWKVASEYITGYHWVGLVVALGLIVWVYMFRYKQRKYLFKKPYYHFLISIILILPGCYVNEMRNGTLVNRVPFVIASSIDEYLKIRESAEVIRKDIGEDATCVGDDTLSVVLIIGEALRNDHLGINGYSRNTTPNLQRLGVIPISKMHSLYSYTAASLPQLLTRADSLDDVRRFEEQSFISIFNRCGFSTLWIANQTPEYTYNLLAKEADRFINVSIENTSYSDKLWTDQNILDHLTSDTLRKEIERSLIVMHSIGSHWFYNYRFPQEYGKYKPIAISRSVNHNPEINLINSYDNTVIFMDYFVSNVIEEFKNDNAILIFLSDHGELLGEEGNWLHATDHDVLYDAGCFVWMSDKYKANHSEKHNSLLHNAKKEWNTSFLFHSILSAGNITSDIIVEDLNMFSNK